MTTLTYLQAISAALRDELRADERVIVMGEDIGVFGGAFKVTDGFIEEFGPDRVMDTPLAESGIIGTAIGAAVVGMRPVCEMQFSDFISCGFDQLVNVAGKMHYRQGLAVPITVRLPSGGGFSGGPFHSQNPEALVHALARDQGGGTVDGRGREGAAALPRSATPTRSATWSTSTCTGGSRARCPRGCSRRRSPRASPARAPTWS